MRGGTRRLSQRCWVSLRARPAPPRSPDLSAAGRWNTAPSPPPPSGLTWEGLRSAPRKTSQALLLPPPRPTLAPTRTPRHVSQRSAASVASEKLRERQIRGPTSVLLTLKLRGGPRVSSQTFPVMLTCARIWDTLRFERSRGFREAGDALIKRDLGLSSAAAVVSPLPGRLGPRGPP